MHMLLTRPQ